jgi:hypothetical protein
MKNIEFTEDIENDNWFDNYAANYVTITPAKQNIPKGWFGKNEILKWELHNIDKDEIEDVINFEILSDIYSKDYWNIEELEDKGAFFFKEGTNDLYQLKNSEDVFMYDFGNRKVLFYVYQIKDVHKRKKVITISGWDANVILDLDDKTIETHYTR